MRDALAHVHERQRSMAAAVIRIAFTRQEQATSAISGVKRARGS